MPKEHPTVYPYIPNSVPAVKQRMLRAVGAESVDEFYADAQDWDWPDIERPTDFEQGGIVGEAEIVGCVTASPSRWFQGTYGFLIRNARPLPFRPCRGMLGFFTPKTTIITPEAKPFNPNIPPNILANQANI